MDTAKHCMSCVNIYFVAFELFSTHFRYVYDLPIPCSVHDGFIELKPKDNEVEHFEVLLFLIVSELC